MLSSVPGAPHNKFLYNHIGFQKEGRLEKIHYFPTIRKQHDGRGRGRHQVAKKACSHSKTVFLSSPRSRTQLKIHLGRRQICVKSPSKVSTPLGRRYGEPVIDKLEELWPKSFIELSREEPSELHEYGRASVRCPDKWRNQYVIYLFITMESQLNSPQLYVGRTENLAKRLSNHISLMNDPKSTKKLSKMWQKGHRVFVGVIYSCDDKKAFAKESLAQNETALIHLMKSEGHALLNKNFGNGEGTEFASPTKSGGGFLPAKFIAIAETNGSLAPVAEDTDLSPSKNCFGWRKIRRDAETLKWSPESPLPEEWSEMSNGLYIARTQSGEEPPIHYIGKTTKSLLERIQQHIHSLEASQESLYEEARKLDEVHFGVLALARTQGSLDFHERRLIREYAAKGKVHNVQFGPSPKQQMSPLRALKGPGRNARPIPAPVFD